MTERFAKRKGRRKKDMPLLRPMKKIQLKLFPKLELERSLLSLFVIIFKRKIYQKKER
jgi:hypothetical protein